MSEFPFGILRIYFLMGKVEIIPTKIVQSHHEFIAPVCSGARIARSSFFDVVSFCMTWLVCFQIISWIIPLISCMVFIKSTNSESVMNY